MRQTLRPHAAKTRPNSRVLFACLLALSLFSCTFFNCIARADNNTPARRESAKTQFEKAEKDRVTLEARSENSRTLKDYASLVAEYKRVYLITPHASDVPAALNYVAELYRTMGDLFDVKYYQSSIDSYQFLIREYPTARYRENALLAIAHMEQDDLHDPAVARNSYEEFLALHPHSSHVLEVRAILAKINADAPKTAPQSSTAKNKPERIAPKIADSESTQATAETKTDTNIDARVDARAGAKTDTKAQ